jgi:UDP-N-acetylmuramyl tripeptide synthase
VAGARVDGHDFVGQAMTTGATCMLATRPIGVPAVVVPDVTAALGRLAGHVLTRTGAQVIALTGSAGKTSTEDLLAQVLAHHGDTVATPGSFNTEIGLPLTPTPSAKAQAARWSACFCASPAERTASRSASWDVLSRSVMHPELHDRSVGHASLR